MSTRLLSVAVLVLGCVVAAPRAAGAQAAPPGEAARAPFVRDGLVIGFSLGGGSFQVVCEACDDDKRFEGGSFTFHVGGMVQPKFAVLFDLWNVTSEQEIIAGLAKILVIGNFVTAAGRIFVGDKLWFQGGIGGANVTLRGGACDRNECDGDTVFAVVVAGGYEVYRSGKFALDVDLRLGVATGEAGSGNMSALQLGFSWY